MNELTKFLTEGLLDNSKTVAIYGGGFKPPTKGHFTVAQEILKQFPEIDELKIFVGSKVRDGVPQKESLEVWNIYKNYLSDKVNVEPSPQGEPIMDVIRYARKHPEEKIYWILGARDGNEGDIKDVEQRKNLLKKYPEVTNVEVKVISTSGGVSGTKTRKAIADNNKEEFFNFIPDIKEKEEVWNMVKNLKESMTPDEVKKADAFADKQLAPIDIDLTSDHVLKRLTGRDSDVTLAQLIGFFKRLGRKKKDFIDFFKNFKEIVVTDKVTNLNIPFINLTNKAIAKTIMRKDNFGTPNPKLIFEKDIEEGVWSQSALSAMHRKSMDEKYFLTDENGDILTSPYKLKTMSSVHKTFKIAKIWGGFSSGKVPKFINVHDLKKDGEVVDQYEWTEQGAYLRDIDPQYIKYKNLDNINEIGDASAKVYPYLFEKDPEVSITKANITFKTTSDRYYKDRIEVNFSTDKAQYVVYFNIMMEKQTQINLSGDPNWKPGPSMDTKASVGFNIKGETEDKDTNLNEQFNVLSTITKIVIEFIEKINKAGGNLISLAVPPKADNDTTSRLDSKRGRLYKAYIKKNLSKIPGYSTREKTSNDGMEYIDIYKSFTLQEIGDASAKKYNWKESYSGFEEVEVEFITDSETKYIVGLESEMFYNIVALNIEFVAKPKGAEGSSSKVVVNKGELFRVMSTITDIIRYYANKFGIKVILYTPSKKEPDEASNQRDRLYKAFITKQIPGVKFKTLPRDEIAAFLPGWEDTVEGEVNADFLLEGKQVGPLYHYTSAKGLKGILSSNRINASEEYYLGNDLYYISFTRNKNFHNKGSKFGVKTDYRITLDGDKLSNRYKISPFAYKPGWNYKDNWEYDWLEDEPESVVRDFFNNTGDYDEQEERISFNGPEGGIGNIKNYILSVDKVEDLQENNAALTLNEGRYDSLTRDVVRDIMDDWKSQFDGSSGKLQFEEDYITTNSKGQPIKFELFAQLTVRKTKTGLYKVDGGADPLRKPTAYLEIKFQVDPRDLPQKWEDIYMDLTDVVRHEIEHMTQQGTNVITSKEMADDEFIRNLIKLKFLPKSDYYKLEQEVDAMLQGMYLKAKKTRTPLKDVIEDYFNKARVPKKDRPDILDLWRKRAKQLALPLTEKKEPAKGTGKKPKGSSRRLYTDENPKDTVGIKFSTKQDIIDTLNKASFKSKPHARQSQIINVIHQRVRAAYGRAKDPEVKKRLKTALEYAEQRKEASKKKTERLKKQKNENVAPNHDGKAAPYGSGYEVIEEIAIDLSNYKGQVLPGDVLRAPKGFPLGGKKLEKSLELKVIKNSREGVNRYKLSLEDLKTGKKYSVRNFQMDGEYKGEKLPQWGLVRKSKENIKERITATEVICDGCGWKWKKEDGGDDLYSCHKCGHDNTPKNDPFGLNELAKDFVKEVFEEAWSPKESFLSLSQYMKDNGMNITPLPKIKVINDDKENASNLLGKTAYYDPNEKSITLYTLDRHPKDVLRSFAHEMVHHEQNLEGKLSNITTTNTNEDGDLPEIEREAYEKGNMMLRNWEDSIKNV